MRERHKDILFEKFPNTFSNADLAQLWQDAEACATAMIFCECVGKLLEQAQEAMHDPAKSGSASMGCTGLALLCDQQTPEQTPDFQRFMPPFASTISTGALLACITLVHKLRRLYMKIHGDVRDQMLLVNKLTSSVKVLGVPTTVCFRTPE